LGAPRLQIAALRAVAGEASRRNGGVRGEAVANGAQRWEAEQDDGGDGGGRREDAL
jgi:hypothetical protein